MKLKVSGREGKAKRLRREGNIPAILYARGGPSKKIVIDAGEFEKHLRMIPKGGLSTAIFELEGEGKAVVKGIEYDKTSYRVMHLDFQSLTEGVPIKLNVPIRCRGVADCVGIKLGGVLRQVIRKLQVKVLPEKIPTEVELDVQKLNIGQTRRLREIVLPEGVEPLNKMDEVAVVIAKR